MLSSSLIVLLAASSLVNGLPSLFRREARDVASVPGLDALQGALGNIDALASMPGADSAVAPPDNAAGRRTKGNKVGGEANKHKGANKNKNHANGNTEAGLVANSTTALEAVATGAVETGAVETGAVETGAANTLLAGEATDSLNGTAIATDALSSATATGDVGASTVTVTVTVTVTDGTEAAGATSTGASEVASPTSVSSLADAQTPDIIPSADTLSTPAPTQMAVSPEQAASADPLDDEDDD